MVAKAEDPPMHCGLVNSLTGIATMHMWFVAHVVGGLRELVATALQLRIVVVPIVPIECPLSRDAFLLEFLLGSPRIAALRAPSPVFF